MNNEEEPKWFIKWKNNDYKHLKSDVENIKTKVNITWKLELVILGAILTGAIGIIVAALWGKL